VVNKKPLCNEVIENFQDKINQKLAKIIPLGCGIAAGSAMLADVCRATTYEERTPILALCNATRQMGILIGPAFQLLLSNINFKIGDWLEITPLNVPGLFMAVLWFFYGIATCFMFFNLATEMNNMNEETRQALFKQSTPITG